MTRLHPDAPCPEPSPDVRDRRRPAQAAGIVSFCDAATGGPWRWEVVDPLTGAAYAGGTTPTLEEARNAARRAGATALELDIETLLAAMPRGRVLDRRTER
jgi:hypothetical protein